MKIEESVVENYRVVSQRKCDFCGAEENKSHPTRGFNVELTPVLGAKDENELACQVCRIHYRKKENAAKKTLSTNKKVFLLISFLVSATVLALTLFT